MCCCCVFYCFLVVFIFFFVKLVLFFNVIVIFFVVIFFVTFGVVKVPVWIVGKVSICVCRQWVCIVLVVLIWFI